MVRRRAKSTMHAWSICPRKACRPRQVIGARAAWRAHGLKPHLIETFTVSRDPQFAEKLEESVFSRVAELTKTIQEYIAAHNQNPKPSSGPPKPTTPCKMSSAQTGA
jgi:hypothetical protein